MKSSLSSLRSAGKPLSDALIVPRSPSKNAFRSGAAFWAATRVGLSSRAAGRSCRTSGSVLSREAVEARQGGARLALEGGQDP